MGFLDMLSPFGGGGSSSFSSGGIGNSDSVNDTANNDARITGGNGSTNSSMVITGGTNTLTDHAAVSQSIGLALRGVESLQAVATQAQGQVSGLLDQALGNSKAQNAAFSSALENVKTADTRALAFGALAVVGLVAVFLFRKG